MGTLGTLLRGETNLLESNDSSFNTINVLAKNVKQGDKVEFALTEGTEFQIVASTLGNATFNVAFKFEGATGDSFVIKAGDQREFSGTILLWESPNELPIQAGTVSAAIIQETIVNPDETENIVPITHDNEFISDEDSVFTGNVLIDDFDGDGDALSITAFDTTGTLGLVTDNGDGTFNYDPNGALDYLNAGENATDSFTYTASDGNGGSDTATVTITINGVDDAPIAKDDSGTVNEDSLITFSFSQLLANDLNVDGINQTIVAIDTAATAGRVVIDTANQTITYRADADRFDLLANGAIALDSFKYIVQGSSGETSAATVAISVAGINDGKSLFGAVRPDTLNGTSGEDVIKGNSGDDFLTGGEGNDRLEGGVGNDWLKGEKGNDMLIGGAGSDMVTDFIDGVDKIQISE